MKTLTELLLAPTLRIADYMRLLVALQHWTPEEHADRQDIALALDMFKQLRKFGDEVIIGLGPYIQLNCVYQSIIVIYIQRIKLVWGIFFCVMKVVT